MLHENGMYATHRFGADRELTSSSVPINVEWDEE